MQELQQTKQPMSLSRFMEVGLFHPEHGYYSAKDKIFNKGGDFTTSPEISQMFGEMIGIWLMTALRNYLTPEQLDQHGQALPPLNSINLVEIGPGSGIMMSDILRTLSQFTGNLKNIQVNLVEASTNLGKKQQDKLLSDLQDKMNMFMTYDIETHKQKTDQGGVERFYNKDQNFSIAWYPTLKDYYNMYLQEQIKTFQSIASDQPKPDQLIKQNLQNPCFILAHELYDALPVYQFEYSEQRQWHERVINFTQDKSDLNFGIHPEPNSENVQKILKPDKLFSKDMDKEIQVGDTIEVCPGAATITQEILSLLEVSRGTALVIDYGEDHAFSNSFRGIKNHKVVKDFKEIVDNIGQIDLTTYVNFQQIKKIAEQNKKMNVMGPMPQGLFLESMGITMRLEILQKSAKTEAQRKLLEDSYIRLCSPEQMGEIYKVLYLGHKEIGEIYPFIGEETMNKEQYFG